MPHKPRSDSRVRTYVRSGWSALILDDCKKWCGFIRLTWEVFMINCEYNAIYREALASWPALLKEEMRIWTISSIEGLVKLSLNYWWNHYDRNWARQSRGTFVVSKYGWLDQIFIFGGRRRVCSAMCMSSAFLNLGQCFCLLSGTTMVLSSTYKPPETMALVVRVAEHVRELKLQ